MLLVRELLLFSAQLFFLFWQQNQLNAIIYLLKSTTGHVFRSIQLRQQTIYSILRVGDYFFDKKLYKCEDILLHSTVLYYIRQLYRAKCAESELSEWISCKEVAAKKPILFSNTICEYFYCMFFLIVQCILNLYKWTICYSTSIVECIVFDNCNSSSSSRTFIKWQPLNWG